MARKRNNIQPNDQGRIMHDQTDRMRNDVANMRADMSDIKHNVGNIINAFRPQNKIRFRTLLWRRRDIRNSKRIFGQERQPQNN